MQSASEMITATYQKQGCPFEPKAGIDGNAQTYGPDDDGYYSDIAQLIETTEIEIKYARGGEIYTTNIKPTNTAKVNIEFKSSLERSLR